MEIKILLLQNIKRHKSNLFGIFILTLLLLASLLTGVNLWTSSENYIEKEIERTGFGDLTIWTLGVEDMDELMAEIQNASGVKSATYQDVLYAEYEINGIQSDSEGIIIKNQIDEYRYRVFDEGLRSYAENGEQLSLQQGEIYLPASAISIYGAKIGDTITFTIARNSVKKEFLVKGFFEDPVMGSSMIGLKSFLIDEGDYEEICQMVRDSGIDGLARVGTAIHMEKTSEAITVSELNRQLEQHTSISNHIEFSHSKEVMLGFMMTLQQFLFAMLLVFAICLLFVTGIVIAHSISMVKEQDIKNWGILKIIGFTNKKIGYVQMLMYFLPLFWSGILGILVADQLVHIINSFMITTLGVRIVAGRAYLQSIFIVAALIGLILIFVRIKIYGLANITPMDIVKNDSSRKSGSSYRNRIAQKHLSFSLAVRSILAGWKNYFGTFLVSVCLVFLMALVIRMDGWLGKDGKGLMDAFNPADLHIAAQSMGDVTQEMIEERITLHTSITDQYDLAMPEVRVKNINLTANVITEPERFHMLQGETIREENQVVLTEFLARDLGVWIGDKISISGDIGNAEYQISGIYQCANDMGMNIGLSQEGYEIIGSDKPNMWCIHYFIKDTEKQKMIMEDLEQTFGGDVYLHENSWPGLYGILSVMNIVLFVMNGIVIAVILVVAILTGKKILAMEQQDMAIYESIGFTTPNIRKSFAIRFLIVSLMGALAGILLSLIVTDFAVNLLLNSFGISNFKSGLRLSNSVIPILMVTGVFTLFSWLISVKIKKLELITILKGE